MSVVYIYIYVVKNPPMYLVHIVAGTNVFTKLQDLNILIVRSNF